MSIRLEGLLPIEKGHCNHPDQKMLYNIMVLLEELVEQNAPKEPPKPEGEKCKHCGDVHENVGEKLSCAKKHKKKG